MNVGQRNGAVTATDGRLRFGQPIPPNGSTNLQYQLSFASKTTATQVQLGVTINGRAGGHGFGQSTELASTGAQFNVVASSSATSTEADPEAHPNADGGCEHPGVEPSIGGGDRHWTGRTTDHSGGRRQ